MSRTNDTPLTFWDHLDVLRGCLWRILLVCVMCGVVAFIAKDTLFGIVLAPQHPDFFTYRMLDFLSTWIGGSGGATQFHVELINTGLSQQFVIHMRTAFYAGFLCASPYVLYSLFRFVSPALYDNERHYAVWAVVWGYVMFVLGVLLSYFLIFPLTFRFLATYQVSTEVVNTITLQSYMDTLFMLTLMMGILFEIPLLCWLMGKLGLLSADFMCRYRKHAVVVILIVAAVITPTADAFTLALVALPVYLLYELGIVLVRKSAVKSV